jgi:hypothetical protein
MKSTRWIVFCALLVLLALGAVPFSPRVKSAQDEPAADEAEWTLLFYMDADNNLELDQMNDLKEMLAAGSTKDVNVVVLAARHPAGDGRRYTNEPVANLENWTSAKLLYVEHNHLKELGDWGKVDMGNQATLKKFLQTAKSFPARHYGIVFEDHGNGWSGCCTDESSGDDMLTTEEIAGALKEATAANGKFELIGFDACLMGNLEVAKAMAPYGRFLVASEETEPGAGWYFTPLLKELAENPKMNGAELGHVIVDTFRDYFAKSPNPSTRREAEGITLGVIALEQIEPLEKAVNELGADNLASLTKEGRASWLKIARARSTAEEYGKSGEDEEGTGLHDLLHLAENLKRQPPDAQTAKAADAVIQAVKNAVVYSIHGRGRPNANGLSIFFPSEKELLTGKQGKSDYSQTAFSHSSKWFPFLAGYTGADATDTEPPDVEDVETNDADMAAKDVATVTAKVKADDIDEASFVLALNEGDQQTILGAIPATPDEKGVLKESWDGEWFTIGDEKTQLICPITGFEEVNAEEDAYWAEVPAQARFKDTNEWFNVTLYFYVDFKGEKVSGDFVFAFEQGKAGPRQIDLEAGDDLRPVYLQIDAKGKEHFVAPEHPDQILHIKDEDDIVVGRERVPKGAYRIGFVVTDFAGNNGAKFIDVKIE